MSAPPARVPAPAAPAQPPATTAPARAPESSAGTPRSFSNADAWKCFIELLGETSGTLAETLQKRGKLADFTAGRAVIQLAGLREPERALVQDPRSQKAAQTALAKLTGAPATIVFEDQSAVRHKRDPYTAKVAEMFDGRIEDEG